MKAVYVTPSSFRTINAGALRNLNIANALARAGHQAVIVSGDGPDDRISDEWDALIAEGVTVRAGGLPRTGALSRVRRLVGGTQIDPPLAGSADAVILYNPGPVQYRRARRSLRMSGIRLLVDISEWFDAEDLPGSRLSPYTWMYEAFMRRLPRTLGSRGRALAISAPMATWLAGAGADVLEVPPLSDVRAKPHEPDEASLRLVLSGSGVARGGKDAGAVEAVIRLAHTHPEVVAGIEIEVLGALDPASSHALAEVGDRVRTVEHGWQPWARTLEIVERADWMLVLRDPMQRRHRLGYPSKVIESLSLGVPVIVNRCGGTTDHLEDGVDAIILEGQSDDELAHALIRARARLPRRGDRRFAPEAWSERLSSFIFDGALETEGIVEERP